MISQKNIQAILKKYNLRNISVGVLGGHSGLDVCAGAKKYGFRTVAVCQKGREKTYAKYYKTERVGKGTIAGREAAGSRYEHMGIAHTEEQAGHVAEATQKRAGELTDTQAVRFPAYKGCVDEVILVDKFADIVRPDVQKKLRSLNTIFVHNRYFWVYSDFQKIENEFLVPIFGNRVAVKLEERDQPKNQYYLLEKAGIRTPKIFKDPKKIDRLVLVKAPEAIREYERAFFVASSYDTYVSTSRAMIKAGKITESGLKKAVIEEYVLGAHVNLNFFYSPLTKSLELLGTDTRRQTNLDGFLRLTADQQLEVLKFMQPKMIETGHIAVTMKESLLEKAYELGEKFVSVMVKEVPPGMIGPFALQGAVVADDSREEFVIFDVSMRIPGSPGIKFTPYSGYLYGVSMSYGERIGMELREAIASNKLDILMS